MQKDQQQWHEDVTEWNNKANLRLPKGVQDGSLKWCKSGMRKGNAWNM